jgi:hypothetical protein
MQNTIVYLSHGGRKYHDQTRYSVLTLLALLIERNRNDVRIAVYTDRPDALPAHDLIHTMAVDAGDLAAWRGPLDYVHRIKLGMLRRALGDLGTPLIYVDSDTRWLEIPDAAFAALAGRSTAVTRGFDPRFHPPAEIDCRVKPGKDAPCFLYKVEGAITPQFFPQYFRLLCNSRDRLHALGLPREPPWAMWNSGAVGIPGSAASFIDDVLRVNDALLPHVGYRNCVEQLALSLVAARRFDIRPFDAYLEHWWPYGTELPTYLRRFFDPLPAGLPAAEEAALAARFAIVEADLRAIQRRPANSVLRWCAKVRTSFYKRRIDLLAFAQRRRRAATEGAD